MFMTSSCLYIVLNILKYVTFYHYQSTAAMMMMLKCLGLTQIFEEHRMSGTCGLWCAYVSD